MRSIWKMIEAKVVETTSKFVKEGDFQSHLEPLYFQCRVRFYFIRTNLPDPAEGHLWDIYNTIRKVESTFRCLKTDLTIRPVYHQNDERTKAHLYLAILAYQLVNTIRYMLASSDIRCDWSNIVRIMATRQIQTIELPWKTKTIHLRKASKPIKEVKDIYDAARCRQPKKR